MNKRRRYKAKRRRAAVPDLFLRATFPWWRAQVSTSSGVLSADLIRRLFERCEAELRAAIAIDECAPFGEAEFKHAEDVMKARER